VLLDERVEAIELVKRALHDVHPNQVQHKNENDDPEYPAEAKPAGHALPTVRTFFCHAAILAHSKDG
jgi:hypothetical protein